MCKPRLRLCETGMRRRLAEGVSGDGTGVAVLRGGDKECGELYSRG